ncbi:MAG: hypothetical protein JRF33_13595 [Deltaproteobacteria bacterium]|nr:hypothetical protein [Deltaproteobacteria bacterium]
MTAKRIAAVIFGLLCLLAGGALWLLGSSAYPVSGDAPSPAPVEGKVLEVRSVGQSSGPSCAGSPGRAVVRVQVKQANGNLVFEQNDLPATAFAAGDRVQVHLEPGHPEHHHIIAPFQPIWVIFLLATGLLFLLAGIGGGLVERHIKVPSPGITDKDPPKHQSN